MEYLKFNVPFVFHHVSTDFCPMSSFSTVDFGLKACTSDRAHPLKFKVGLTVDKLFNCKIEEHIDTFRFIRQSENQPWPPSLLEDSRKISEQLIMLCVSTEILKPLCTEVVMEMGYKRMLEQHPLPDPKIKFQPIGMGGNTRWHGTPDVRVRGTELSVG